MRSNVGEKPDYKVCIGFERFWPASWKNYVNLKVKSKVREVCKIWLPVSELVLRIKKDFRTRIVDSELFQKLMDKFIELLIYIQFIKWNKALHFSATRHLKKRKQIKFYDWGFFVSLVKTAWKSILQNDNLLKNSIEIFWIKSWQSYSS